MGALDLVTWWPVDAAAGGVARPTDAGDRATVVDSVGDTGRPFAWASLTKLLVAMAVLVAVEEGTITLDDPAGPPGSTVRHLLAHASGLGPDSPVPVAGPGRMRIYSNIGYELLADLVAEHAHMPFGEYVRAGVLKPLEMSTTWLPTEASPASGAEGSVHDLMIFAGELLAPTIVSSTTLDLATSVAFPGLRGVLPGYGRFDPCDWGLGFEVKGAKQPHWTGTRTSAATFGHFGRAGGFVWVDRTIGVACATLSNRDFGPWAVSEWSTLADAVVDEWAPPVCLPESGRRGPQAAPVVVPEVVPIPPVPPVPPQGRPAAPAPASPVVAIPGDDRATAAHVAAATDGPGDAQAARVEAERRRRKAREAERQREREAARAEAAEDNRRARKGADADGRVLAMAEHRDAVDVRIGEAQTGETTTDEHGPLGPGIRPVDFWGDPGT